MRIKFIILFITLSFVLFSNNFKSIFFRGIFFYDEESSISVIPSENKEVIVIANLNYHYALILPYAENWEIILDDKYVLNANNKSINIYLELLKNDGKTSKEYLENLVKPFLDDKEKLGIIDAEVFNYNNELILAIVVDLELINDDAKYRGIKQVNYYTSKTFKDERFKLYLTFMQKKSKVELNNTEIFDYLTIGFNIDFERDK